MFRLRLVPDNTRIPFMGYRRWTLPISAILSVLAIVLFVTPGPNFGIDFLGGTIVEVATKDGSDADLAAIRSTLSGLQLGDVQVQTFGTPNDVLIRIGQQEGGEAAQLVAVDKVRAALGGTLEERRVETVGPRVSGELAWNGGLALVVTLAAIMVYVWFRFEWQFAVGAIIATLHDVIITLGFFVVTGLEFNLSSLAAILTIVGYSLNDTVVVYDRIRETLRKYKKLPLSELIDAAINDTLARTTTTGFTTILALGALYVFGGEVIRSFTAAMIFGVVIGTWSSIFIAAPILIYFGLRPDALKADKAEAAEKKGA